MNASVNIERNGDGYLLKAEQWFDRPISEIFEIFCDASNLEQLTPSFLKFEIMTPTPIDMREGALIDYRISIRGIPINWKTEITEWNPPHHFVDSQLRGPYHRWIHRHTFVEKDGGTLVGDVVDYKPRGGSLMHWFFVARDLRNVFRFRHAELEKVFGLKEDSAVVT